MDEMAQCAAGVALQARGRGSTARRTTMPNWTAWRWKSQCNSRAVQTGRDDVALLGFTSGTTGEPKATMHFHRDLLIIADGYAKEVLGVVPDDVFVGSPPLGLYLRARAGLRCFPCALVRRRPCWKTPRPPT
jgi:2-aminobenzoate-CoA ligase